MLILQRDQHALEGSQQVKRRGEDDRNPYQQMEPKRRRERDLEDQRQRYDKNPYDEGDEDSRPVSRIVVAIVEAAARA